MQSVQPRILNMPHQLGLGVQMHRQFGSRFLIDTLKELGFCSSYSEIQRYERCAAVHFGTDIPGLGLSAFLQHMAVNFGHNLRTLDGYNTFHGIGKFSVTTHRTEIAKIIPRVKVKTEYIIAAGKVNITVLKPKAGTLPSLRSEKLPDFTAEDRKEYLGILSGKHPGKCNLKGLLGMFIQGSHTGVSSIFSCQCLT